MVETNAPEQQQTFHKSIGNHCRVTMRKINHCFNAGLFRRIVRVRSIVWTVVRRTLFAAILAGGQFGTVENSKSRLVPGFAECE